MVSCSPSFASLEVKILNFRERKTVLLFLNEYSLGIKLRAITTTATNKKI